MHHSGSSFSYSTDITNVDSASIMPAFPSRNEDLKSMLDNNKDGPKVEAMKRLITMIAKGRASSDSDARELFPHVVRNVVTKNAELKKLVYLYLTRYAEQEQDLALLSISSFQRSLKDPNPLIRASALRVLSSIRVHMIAPIMLIAIRDCSNDMSAYVRKTAAHSTSKLYHLDPDLKEEIVQVIAKLLQDKTSLVLSSALAAFEEICPERFDLIHANYRKFVSLMPDFDEWGQVILIGMLIRYGRTQFLDPNTRKDDVSTDSSDQVAGLIYLDPDHRLLLRNAKPLLQSRNSAVIMAVVQLYLALAPESEINSLIIKPLIRLLHSHPEIQVTVLTNIVTLTGPPHPSNGHKKSLKILFEPFLKSFFIKSRDSTHVKILKLRVLTNLSTPSNIPLILREFQAYIHNYQVDMEFVSATIQAIGKCASRIEKVAPTCLSGLISLLSNRNEAIVAQSIIVIRTQIIEQDKGRSETTGDSSQNEENGEKDEDDLEDSFESIRGSAIVTMIIKQVVRLIDKIETPNARAAILWILAEFCDRNEKSLLASPDVLRIIATSFCTESNLVKLQAMNLASKLYFMSIVKECSLFDENEKNRIKILVNYVFNLAKYDVNYDVRDRGRFLKQLLSKCDNEEGVKLTSRILMSPKTCQQPGTDGDSYIDFTPKFRIGTLSHFLDKKVNGYEELTDFPETQPDTSVRQKPGMEEEVSQGPAFELIKKDHLSSKNNEGGFFSSEDENDSGSEMSFVESESDSSESSETSKDEDEDDEEDEETQTDEEEEEEEETESEEDDEDDTSSEELGGEEPRKKEISPNSHDKKSRKRWSIKQSNNTLLFIHQKEEEDLNLPRAAMNKIIKDFDTTHGESGFIDNEPKTTGLKVGHSEKYLKEGHQYILTLQDKSVLDDSEDVLENVNIVDLEKADKNIARKLKKDSYTPYDEPDDELNASRKKSILHQYDEEIDGPSSDFFRIGETNSQAKKVTAEQLKDALSLDLPKLEVASEYFTADEMKAFKKPKKPKLRKKEKRLEESLPLTATDSDHGSRKSRDKVPGPSPSREKFKPVNKEPLADVLGSLDDVDDDSDDDMFLKDLSTVVLEEEEAEEEFRKALEKAKKLKEKVKQPEEEEDIDSLIAQNEARIKKEQDEDNEASKSGLIVLDATAEFCRNLGNFTTTEVKEEEEDEMMDYQKDSDDMKDSDEDSNQPDNRGKWNEVDLDAEKPVDDLALMDTKQPILEEEPDVSLGVALALKVAMKKGYLDKEDREKVSGSRHASSLQAQNYTIEEKFYDDDKHSRRERYNRHAVTPLPVKPNYNPNPKLEYADDKGRPMSRKEAFRVLSHKFHGKGPSKNKIDKRMKKQDQESKLRQMNASDTPLGTLKLLQEKQKEMNTPYVVLAGASTSMGKK
ncbi:uncharacterized protein LOC141851429 [Brevipalpus obovatus]|uniref:uncharacterized protein LOC141851429 n=1 Tax=Brevipalpus obovatus TaxID=246614 RepID=UPI003D9DD864